MIERSKIIQKWIDTRKEKNQLTNMIFAVTVVAEKFYDPKATADKFIALLDRNNVEYNWVDTIPGAWNLNRDWIETDVIPCAVEYCGCYPANWAIEDVVQLEQMENDGEIVIIAMEKTAEGRYIPNH